jgi:ribose transport system ATP-binding protein
MRAKACTRLLLDMAENAADERGVPGVTALLQMSGISKRFGGTQALRSVDITAESGEVHAIVGENGAGKSTLSRILTGAVQSDAGEIRLDGEPQAITSPLRGHQLGIRMVHQHANLVPNLSVTENVLLGGMPTRGRSRWWIDWEAAHRRVQEILDGIGFEGIDVRRRVARLSPAQRQIVEIAKAVAVKPNVLIMD